MSSCERTDGGLLPLSSPQPSATSVAYFSARLAGSKQGGGGASHMADLQKPGTTEFGSVLQPLFNPTIELADQRGLGLSGYVTMLEDGAVVKVEQVWLVIPSRPPE